MKRTLVLFLLLLTVSLAGCLPQNQATPTLKPTDASAVRPAPTVGLSVPTGSAFLPDAGCTVITKKPTPGPTAESIYPPVGEAEHVRGPASARVTIIEYSDFQ